MLRRHGPIAVGAVLLGLALPVVARAEVLTWVMEGTVQNVVESPAGWSSLGQVGDRVSYSVTFNSDAPQLTQIQCAIISTSFHLDEEWFLVSHPELSFSAQPPESIVLSGWWDGNISGSVDFRLSNYAGSPLTYADLPPQSSGFGSTVFTVMLYGPVYPEYKRISGTIDAFYAIPEPASFLLGLAVLTFASRRPGQLRASR